MRRARGFSGVGAALALLVATTGCGDDEGDPGSAGSPEADWSVADSVAALPALEDGPLTITTADLDAVAEANGLDTPDSLDDATPDWLATMSGTDDAVAMVVAPAFIRSSPPDDLVETTGFWWGAADAFASVSVPPEELSVFTGDDLGEPEAGEPLHVATADDGGVVVSRSDTLLEDWLAGDATTLDGDEPVTAVAEALDEAGAISAAIVGLTEAAPTIGIGWLGEADGDAAVAIVYGFASADEAADAESGLESGFADIDELTVDDVATSGSTLTVMVRVAPDRVAAPYELLVVRGDLPLPAP